MLTFMSCDLAPAAADHVGCGSLSTCTQIVQGAYLKKYVPKTLHIKNSAKKLNLERFNLEQLAVSVEPHRKFVEARVKSVPTCWSKMTSRRRGWDM